MLVSVIVEIRLVVHELFFFWYDNNKRRKDGFCDTWLTCFTQGLQALGLCMEDNRVLTFHKMLK